MSWADFAIKTLQSGQVATITPHGNSMKGKVNSGDTVILSPAKENQLEKGDIVLVKVKGNVYLHLITAINGSRFLIGNNKGGTNGWVGVSAIFGVATTVEGKIIKRI